METFFFYDLETSGRDPRWHRIVQFAGVRTDANLEPIEDPLAWDVRLDEDVIPDPEACLVTGLTPQQLRHGIDEGELFERIAAEFARPRTCVVGYNNLRFDDEFIRYGFWRNLRDPYAREWQGGNSRWDLIDLARMMAALRPDGMQWPQIDDRISFRLEDLATANGIEQVRAHDATSDVFATLGLAQAMRAAQPKLYAFNLELRNKHRVAEILGEPLTHALLHVSPRYAAATGRVAVVTPVAAHPVNRNSVVVADLGAEVDVLERLDAETLARALFTPAKERGDLPAVGLQEVHLNKVPAVAPLGVLGAADADRLGIDLDRCRRNLEKLRRMPELARRVQSAYGSSGRAGVADVDGALYDGFLPDADRRVLLELSRAAAEELASPPPLQDERARELVFRYTARRQPQLLDDSGRECWNAHLRELYRSGRDGMAGIDETRGRLDELAAAGADPSIIDALREHLDTLVARVGSADGSGQES